MSIAVKTADGWQVIGVGSGGNPGAAVIGPVTPNDPLYPVNKSSFTGDGTNGELGQLYDVYDFLGSGTLNVTEAGFVDVAVIGAGGGGQAAVAGGGGAGGYVSRENVFVSAGDNDVLVGGGGSDHGTGSGSSFASVSAIGGGAGGNANAPGHQGASGGGGGQWSALGGLNIVNQGNLGGNGSNGNGPGASSAGGGGGVGSAGETAVTTRGGNGGAGITINFAGYPLDICGGGGGGSYGGTQSTASHGGGAGATDGPGTSGTANTGGGGGGGGHPTNGSSNGGSGRVIIRVKVNTRSFDANARTTAPRTAHAARIEDGIVRQVIVIPHLDNDDEKITEYCNRIGLPGTWVDTSYTGSRRGKYACIGDTFTGDEFVVPVVEPVQSPGDDV
jgi:hypothetical protein